MMEEIGDIMAEGKRRKGGKTAGANSWGSLEKLPSGRWRAMYTGPDKARHKAPQTFANKTHADGWLRQEKQRIDASVESGRVWIPPELIRERELSEPTLRAYAPEALQRRGLRQTTLEDYRRKLKRNVYPLLGDYRLSQITATLISEWYQNLLPDKPTTRAHVYSVVHSLFDQAVREDLIEKNPCTIRGAGKTSKKRLVRLPSDEQIDIASATMPDWLAATVKIAAWCGLRAGEVKALQRQDIDFENNEIHVRRAVTTVNGDRPIGLPKTKAGTRAVPMPLGLADELQHHLDRFVGPLPESWLFPAAKDHSKPIPTATLYRHWRKARKAADLGDFHFHDLRHLAGSRFAATVGAAEYEVADFLGQDAIGATRRYFDPMHGRKEELKARLSQAYNEAQKKTETEAQPPDADA
jgi:integrase